MIQRVQSIWLLLAAAALPFRFALLFALVALPLLLELVWRLQSQGSSWLLVLQQDLRQEEIENRF